MDKTILSAAGAVSDIGDGAVVMIGGFGGSGAPVELIHTLIDKGSGRDFFTEGDAQRFCE